ncbi:MAG: phosphoribosylaminoimidazolesuccinocarboxamide synthase [Flammeovirgaceae bacterium]
MLGIKETNFKIKNCQGVYHGKVRDVYDFGNKLAMVATDRISAFDVVLDKGIPYKGQVLNLIAAKFLQITSDIVPNWVEDVPHSNVTIGRKCKAFPVEMVIRGYLAGHAWREYKSGKRSICGVSIPDGLKENDKLPQPIITPTTKAAKGAHDEDISREEILRRGLVNSKTYEKLENFTQALYKRGNEYAQKRGLILVDTKYEFGEDGGEIYLIDEVHTPDSSRYFYLDGYEERQKRGEQQKQLSKEFVRQWLIDNGFQGKSGQKQPFMSDEFVENITNRYIELYEKVLAQSFYKGSYNNILLEIEKSIENHFVKNA